jgi:RNA polymerase sigma factor for flagellar operon FliA
MTVKTAKTDRAKRRGKGTEPAEVAVAATIGGVWQDDPPEVWAACRAGDRGVREALIQRYLPLARHFYAKFVARVPRNADRDPILSAADQGLWEAVERYDPQRGASFATFASRRIRGAMLDALRAMLGGRRKHWISFLSLDAAAHEDSDRETLVKDITGDERLARRTSLDQGFFAQLVRGLPFEWQVVLYLYHAKGHTMREVGQVLHLSESRVSQIHSEAVGWLQKSREKWEVLEAWKDARA